MNPLARAATRLADEIAVQTASMGKRVTIDPVAVLDRSDSVALAKPGLWSANRSCRFVRAADGWIAVNLARPDDRELIPAWLGEPLARDAWAAIEIGAAKHSIADLRANARLLGLPVAVAGEASARPPTLHAMGAAKRRNRLRVIDLSSLWAGPLCAGVLAAMGAEVIKIESRLRPDTTRQAAPALDARLNGGKQRVVLDFGDAEDRATLWGWLCAAGMVVTNARRRAFAPLGIAPEAVFAANPGLIWVAISGYGWMGDGVDRVAFGDDAAAAGGLLRRTPRGEPRFMGDAVADPLTGLAAAAAALEAVGRGGGFLVDAAMASVAATAAE